MNLRRCNKRVALLHLSIYYTWKNIKKSYRSNKNRISETTWNVEFKLPGAYYFVSHIEVYFGYTTKKHETQINLQFKHTSRKFETELHSKSKLDTILNFRYMKP